MGHCTSREDLRARDAPSPCTSRCDDFERLADVHHKRTGDIGHVDPLTVAVEGLQAFDVGRRRLQQKRPPAGRVLCGPTPCSVRAGALLLDAAG